MGRRLVLGMGLLMLLLLSACGGTAPASTPAQSAGVLPEITVYKSPT